MKFSTRTDSFIHELRAQEFGETSYHFINPLLGCETIDKKFLTQFPELEKTFQTTINKYLDERKAKTVSVYFDTRDGNWLAINQKEKYFPASLMKVPTMIAFYKLAESHPEILTKKVVYTGSEDLNKIEYFKPAQTLVPGNSYTIEELIEHMILYSDNNAPNLLLENIDNDYLTEVFSDIGLSIPADVKNSLADFITVKAYVNFFRVLYNATYLNRALSEKALFLLSKPDFPYGIQAGLPTNMQAARKFGERNFANTDNNATSDKELHDCGIIYYPKHPYMLCVMTKGTNFNDLGDVIKNISGLTYKFVDSQNRGKD